MKKLKKCDYCGKDSVIYKNFTTKEGRKKACTPCANKQDALLKKEKVKLFKEKRKVKRAKEMESRKISFDSLLKDYQKLVRMLTSDYCCTCKQKFSETRQKQGGHFMRRGLRSTCFLFTNISQQCNFCNSQIGGQGEQYLHGLYLDKFWGEGTARLMTDLSRISYKFSKPELVELRKLVDEGLSRSVSLTNLNDKRTLLEELTIRQQSMDFYKHLINECKRDSNNE